MNLFNHLVFEDLVLVNDLDGNTHTSFHMLAIFDLCKSAFSQSFSNFILPYPCAHSCWSTHLSFLWIPPPPPPPSLISFSPWSELCWPHKLLHPQVQKNSNLCGHNHYIFIIKGIVIYMLLPWRAWTRDNRTLLLTHHMHYGTYHLPSQMAASNATSVISCCVQRRTWFQMHWSHIAWRNLASNLRNSFPSTSTHLSCRRDGRLRKGRSKVTDLLLHRSQRSSCQDHNTDAASSKADLHAR